MNDHILSVKVESDEQRKLENESSYFDNIRHLLFYAISVLNDWTKSSLLLSAHPIQNNETNFVFIKLKSPCKK